jgi:hypothetical protein
LIKVSDDDIKSHWKRNKAKYKITETIPAPPTTAPTTSAPAPTTTTREKTFSEARMDVERELREMKAEKRAEEAMRDAAAEMIRPWFDQTTDQATGFKPIPEVVKDPNFMKNVRERIARKHDISIEFNSSLQLSSKEELSRNTTIGRAEVAGERLMLPEYAFRVPGLFKPDEMSDTTLRLQLHQTPDAPLSHGTIDMEKSMAAQALIMKKQSLVLFRVLEVKPSEPPASLAEVRPAVEKDVRLQRAFAKMEATANELYSASQKVGLASALQALESIRTKTGISAPSNPPATARKMQRSLTTPNVPGIGASEEFVQACFDMARDDWTPPATVAAPTTQAVTTMPARVPAPKVTLVSLPKLRKWAVVEFVGLDPVAQDKYDQTLRKDAFSTLQSMRASEVQTAWFDLVNIEKRCNYERLKETDSGLPHTGIQQPDAPVF